MFTDCITCGCSIHLADGKAKELQKSGTDYYCPNGHQQHFIVGKTPDQKRIVELERVVAVLNGRLEDANNWRCSWCGKKLKVWSIYPHLHDVHKFPGVREVRRAIKAKRLLEKNP